MNTYLINPAPSSHSFIKDFHILISSNSDQNPTPEDYGSYLEPILFYLRNRTSIPKYLSLITIHTQYDTTGEAGIHTWTFIPTQEDIPQATLSSLASELKECFPLDTNISYTDPMVHYTLEGFFTIVQPFTN